MSTLPSSGASPAAASTRVLWAMPLLYVLIVMADMLAMTHITLSLTARGASVLAVGAMASTFWICIMLASLLASRVIARYGLATSFNAATLLSALSFLSLALHERYVLWLAGMALVGLGVGLLWVAGEAWLAESAPPQRRGFYVGLVETAVGIGTVFGPLVLPLLRWWHAAPLAWACGFEAAAVLLGWGLLRGQPEGRSAGAKGATAHDGAGGHWRVVATPMVLLAVIGGVLESGSGSLLPAISMHSGFGLDAAAALATVINLGGALLPTPFGLLADRLGMRRILLLSWGMLVLAAMGLVVVGWIGLPRASGALWPLGFFVTGMGTVVYTLVTIELGHRLTGDGLVRALASMVTAYTAGTSIGPFVGGALFDQGGLLALAPALVLTAAAGGIVTWRTWAVR